MPSLRRKALKHGSRTQERSSAALSAGLRQTLAALRAPDHLDAPVDAWKGQGAGLGLDRVARFA